MGPVGSPADKVPLLDPPLTEEEILGIFGTLSPVSSQLGSQGSSLGDLGEQEKSPTLGCPLPSSSPTPAGFTDRTDCPRLMIKDTGLPPSPPIHKSLCRVKKKKSLSAAKSRTASSLGRPEETRQRWRAVDQARRPIRAPGTLKRRMKGGTAPLVPEADHVCRYRLDLCPSLAVSSQVHVH